MNFLTPRSELLTCKNKFLPQTKFSTAGQISTLWDFFIALIDVWHCTNWEMVTNNFTDVIKVTLTDVALSESLMYTFIIILIRKTGKDLQE